MAVPSIGGLAERTRRLWRPMAAARRRPSAQIALLSVNIGGIDELKPIPQHPLIDTYIITDAEGAAASPAGRTWTRVLGPMGGLADYTPRMQARYYKTQIHRLDFARRYRWLVWADASVLFNDLDFIASAVDRLARRPRRGRLLLVPHPYRRTVREEYLYVRTSIEDGVDYLVARYSIAALTGQMSALASEQMNVDGRLWASGFWLVENNVKINACWDEWWAHLRPFGGMDQLPLPPLVEAFGLVPKELRVDIFKNKHFRIIPHADHGTR